MQIVSLSRVKEFYRCTNESNGSSFIFVAGANVDKLQGCCSIAYGSTPPIIPHLQVALTEMSYQQVPMICKAETVI